MPCVNWNKHFRRPTTVASIQLSKPLATEEVLSKPLVIAAEEVVGKHVLVVHFPVEIILKILEQLPPEDKISFALTCRGFYATCPASAIKTLSRQGREDLLLRLEGDVGHQYSFCPGCAKLHRFDGNLGATSKDVAGRAARGSCLSSSSFKPLIAWTRGSRDLSHQMARLLWINHRYGPVKGISPEEFCQWYQKSAHSGRPSDRWRVGLEIKFIDNQMMLKATHYIQGNSMAQLMQCPEITDHKLCMYIFAVETCPPRLRWEMDSAMTVRKEHPNCLQTRTPGCRNCHTDWDLSQAHVHGENSAQDMISIIVQTYHLFEDPSDDKDPLWLLLVGLESHCFTTRLRGQICTREHSRNVDFELVGHLYQS